MSGWTRRSALGGAVAGLASRARAAGNGDIALLRRAYTELHPGLLRYSTAEQTSARFDALERTFGEAADQKGRYLALSRFLSSVRCGHTYANFFNQKKTVQAELFSGTDRLPFQFLWIGERMIVTADSTGTGVAPGTKVLAIDGQGARETLAALLPYARADGSNDAKRRRLMSVQAEDRFETFDVFHPLVFGSRDRFRLSLRTPDGRTREQTVSAIGLDARRAQLPPQPNGDAAVWTFERRGSAAVLTMPTWAVFNSKWDWKAWLTARFEEMDRTGVQGLVIDLRGNEGGNDCGDEIVARLIDTPVQLRNSRRLVRYRKTPDELKAALDTWDPSFRDWGTDARLYDARFYELVQKEDDGLVVGEVRPQGPRFKGKVAVLIGPQNSSATHQFADSVQRLKLATLVGEETGGNLRGINGGAFFFLRLPESGLEADLPIIGAFPRDPQPDRGVRPDVAIPRTAASIGAGTDPALDRSLSIVSG